MEMAEWVKRGGVLPKCSKLKKELTSPTYSFKKGKFILESKDQIKDRLGYSPDHADALALTFALPDQPSKNSVMRSLKPDGVKHDYDPLA